MKFSASVSSSSSPSLRYFSEFDSVGPFPSKCPATSLMHAVVLGSRNARWISHSFPFTHGVSRLTLVVRQMLIQIINNDIYYAARRNRINKGPEVSGALFAPRLCSRICACLKAEASPPYECVARWISSMATVKSSSCHSLQLRCYPLNVFLLRWSHLKSNDGSSQASVGCCSMVRVGTTESMMENHRRQAEGMRVVSRFSRRAKQRRSAFQTCCLRHQPYPTDRFTVAC